VNGWLCERSMRCCVLALCLPTSLALAGASVSFDFSPDPLAKFRAAPVLELLCPTPAIAPVVDGVLDDACWREAAVIERLGASPPGTSVKVCANKDTLFIAVLCTNAKGRPPQAQQRERDDGAWRDDCIEVWIAPDLQRTTFFQFVVNSTNSIYDAMNYGGRAKPAHNPRWAHAVSLGEESWTVEMTVPFVAVGLERWQRRIGFNIGRNGRSVNPRAWNGKYSDATASVLMFPDAPERAVAKASTQAIAVDARVQTSGEALRIAFERLEARPGERWIEGRFHVTPARLEVGQCKLTAALFAPGRIEPLDQTSVSPSAANGTLALDLRRHGMVAARLCVTLTEGDETTGCAEALLSARGPEGALVTGTRIPVAIDAPEGVGPVQSWPVTFGVPFAAGTLWDVTRLQVVNGDGTRVPHQCAVVGWWARDGAVKWVRCDALVSSADGCFVAVTDGTAAVAAAQGLRLTTRDDDIIVDTGAAVYTLGPGHSPIRTIVRDGRTVATGEGTRGLYVIDQEGNVASASADGEDVQIETDGPVAACVRFEGFYRRDDGTPVARHVTRLEFSAGQAFVRATHTFTITCDTNEVWFRDIGWELATAPGNGPSAAFGTARADWRQSASYALEDGRAVSMLQDSHYRHAHGINHFVIGHATADGRIDTLLEGEECGDWAAVSGSDGGLMVSCRETARQHPKEFVVARDRVDLKLHSSRGGEELDFRMPALVKRWDLQKWHEGATSETRRVPIVERALQNQSNAVGWSRTSFVMFSPLPAEAPVAAASVLSRLTSAQVYAHIDPAWLCASGAMGRIHQRDPERFADAERAIVAAFRLWEGRIGEWGDYGFVDYFNGPHLGYRGKYVAQKRYSKAMYTLKVDLWRLYARSGDRRMRSYIENVARTFMDVDVAQWDGDGRVKGLFHSPPGSDLKPSTPANLPMPWSGPARMNYSSTTNMNLIAWDYYLTGNRRAKDVMFDFAEGAKRYWTPVGAARDGRPLMVFRALVQTYAFTLDPVLRAMAEATTDQFYDPQCELALTKNRPYSSTYKTQVDLRGIEDGWQILGGDRYHEMLMKMAARWWTPLLGSWPHFYCNPQARVGSLLYREANQAHVPQVLATQVRYSASAYDAEKDHTFGSESAAKCTFIFEGLPYAMETLVRTNADREPTASWVGYEDFGYPSSIIVWKAGEENVDFVLRTASQGQGRSGDIIVTAPKLELLNPGSRYGLDLQRLQTISTGGVSIHLPKDGPEGAYRVTPSGKGFHICYADSRTPLVIHASEYWRPAPEQRPAIRYYFKLPEGTSDGQMFFEGKALLFDPVGSAWPTDEPQHGWITLPGDRPGLWSFVPVENEIVGSRNIPPFFAVESASSYFEPDIPWQRKPSGEFQRPPAEQVFVDGAIAAAGNQAVQLTADRCINLQGGDPHASGDGLRFTPFSQGTIEFWMKPNWHTCELRPEGSKALIYLTAADGKNWSLWHYVKPRSRNSYHDFLFSHVLYGYFYSDGLAKYSTLRRYRRTVFEPGEWTHVAWVWGKEDGITPRNPPYHTKVRDEVLIARIFVNGKQGSNTGYRWYGNDPVHMPTALSIGRYYASANIDAAVDELRVSDVQRYTSDFVPSRETEFELDEHTRALFHFNGDLGGASWEYAGVLPVKLGR